MKKFLFLLILLPMVSACSADDNNYYYRESAPEVSVHNRSPYYKQPPVTRYYGHEEQRQRVARAPSREHHGHQSVQVERHGHN